MADKDRGAELPQRVPGAVRAGPVSPTALALPEELRQRMQAAVIAELAKEANAGEQERASEERTTGLPGREWPPESVVSEEASLEESSFPANGIKRKRNRRCRGRICRHRPERMTGPVPKDHVAKWPGSAVEPQPAVRVEPVVKARAAAEPGPAVQPEPGKATTPGWGSPDRAGPGRYRHRVAGRRRGRPPLPPRRRLSLSAQAAAWVTEQVSPDVTVSCDAVMCAALQAPWLPREQAGRPRASPRQIRCLRSWSSRRPR